MTAADFRAAVQQNPADDTPRLAYADWLDDGGDAARAEFIRVQCELAKLDATDPRRPALEDREHELLAAHEREWLPWTSTGTVGEWDVRRGFLHQLLVPRRNFAVETANDPVERVDLTDPYNADPDDADFDPRFLAAGFLPRLRLLSLSSLGRSWPSVARLLRYDQFSGVSELDAGNVSGLSWAGAAVFALPFREGLKALALGGRSGPGFDWANAAEETLDPVSLALALQKARLRSLAVFDCGLTGPGVRHLLQASCCENLHELDIADNHLAADAFWAFDAPAALDKLDVSGTPLGGISLEPLLRSPMLRGLTRLELNRCGSARRNMEVLADSAFWSRATEFRVHGGTIPADTLEPLFRSTGPADLQTLDLGDNYVRSAGVAALAATTWAKSLTYLDLGANYIDDAACVTLASGAFPRLRTLHLARNNFDQIRNDGEIIGDAGATALAAAPHLSRLRILSVGYTGVTDTGAAALLNSPTWKLSGLGLAGLGLTADFIPQLAASPKLARLTWLDLSNNPALSGEALLPLAESPYLSPLCDLDLGGVYVGSRVAAVLRERLGPRLSL